ncbi:polysaccharide deacetylase family protein, partial [Candidatus Saccharibacteria bacterium]|nr:polysaccharide deacetylase family protein [Candidatus Saccharibacteria bacterium]
MIFITTLLVVLVLYGLFMSPYVQLFGKYPYKIDTTEKIVALTFDDGPNGRDTEMLLDVLKRHNVKATFFVVG